MNERIVNHSKRPGQTRQGYFYAPDEVFDWSISATAKLVYLNLRRRADKNGYCFPPAQRIADDCTLSVPSVRRALRDLKKAGRVKIKTQGHKGRANLYQIESGSSAEVDQIDPPGRSNRPLKGGHIDPPRTPILSKTQEGLSPATAGDEREVAFADEQEVHIHEQRVKKTTTPPSFSPQPTEQDGVDQLVREFYHAIGVTTVVHDHFRAGRKVIARLRAAGHTTEDIHLAIFYVERHNGDFDRPVHSIGFLPHIIDKARAEAQQQAEVEERRRRHAETRQQLEKQEKISPEDVANALMSVSPKRRDILRQFAEMGAKRDRN